MITIIMDFSSEVVACALVYNESLNKVLLVRQIDSYWTGWCLPNAKVRYLENSHAVVKRELSDQLGITPAFIDRHSEENEFGYSSKHSIAFFNFVVVNCGELQTNGNIYRSGWFDLKNLPRYGSSEKIRRYLKRRLRTDN
jgi:ADP-ribose pyrophosphatase YjhB (NUDIX family)